MSKQLYEEALADVKKLKEVAEDNAKRALLDAVTPRIRDLIETQLLGEAGIEDDDRILNDIGSFEEEDEVAIDPYSVSGGSDASASAISMPDDEGKVTLDLDALVVPGSEGEEFELSMESAKSLGMLLRSDKNGKTKTFEGKMKALVLRVERARKASPIVKESRGYSTALSAIISEVEDTYSHLQSKVNCSSEKKARYESILENLFATLNSRLMENKMTRRRSRYLSEADIKVNLTGLPDDVDLDNIGVDLISGDEEGEEPDGDEGGGDEDGGEDTIDLEFGDDDGDSEGGDDDGDSEGGDDDGGEDTIDLDVGDEDEDKDKKSQQGESRRFGHGSTIVEIDEVMLRREVSRMRALREEKVTTTKGLKSYGSGRVADGFEDDNLGDPFVDIDVTTESQGMLEFDMSEGDDDEKEAEGDDKETKVENLCRRLRSEARIQLEAKKKATQSKKQQKEAQQKAVKAQKQKKQQESQKQKKQSKRCQEAYVYYATKYNESVARSNRMKSMLTEATSNGRSFNRMTRRTAAESNVLRNKLTETNLFNAKLLFTNKLLQNEVLTKRQKAEVIERLDEARSEREVKLVYESLVKTLQGSSSRRITEGTNRSVLGSSSRPMRSSGTATLNEGFESERWAKLAGIMK